MSEHIIKTDNFFLKISADIDDSDIDNPVNTILTVEVISCGFSAKAEFETDEKKLSEFSENLNSLYNTLDGSASICETYGYKRYVSFSANKRGIITACGFLCDEMRNNELKFENSFDQTYLESFASGLNYYL